ncbi:HAMP domain-containing histidine kinase [Leptolyngbya sp. CCY15150]|uniref:sensor histidine kinase n=1 Tax=Leptolyngbya sp. CCY15150 TaxID=2767772 RepID=UPI001950348F|nr:HAMP domain-containing histidine kinase [Leptolyngbya sp. CCY15150]
MIARERVRGMPVNTWYAPTLSEIIALGEQDILGSLMPNAAPPPLDKTPEQRQASMERQWSGAIAALNACFAAMVPSSSDLGHSAIGVVLSGPAPILQSGLADHVASWTMTAELSLADWLPYHLLPSSETSAPHPFSTPSTLPLLGHDPLVQEQFCLALTPQFGVVMTLGRDTTGDPVFLVSFVPDVVMQAWRSLRSRLVLSAPHVLSQLDHLVQQFTPPTPDYRVVTQFHRLMLMHLPEPNHGVVHNIDVAPSCPVDGFQPMHAQEPALHPTHLDTHGRADVELLRAIAHEVRTPLTTIRTLTRLLLRRKEVTPDIAKRLAMIDRECTQQIDRFNLIFRAVELETEASKPCAQSLASISLKQVFHDGVPQWQERASQRNLTLDVRLPQTLPMVVSDPVMLNQMLSGLIDRITQTLPSGSHIQMQVSLAGSQLKLQLRSHLDHKGDRPTPDPVSYGFFAPTLQSIGDLLMFQPETGNLSLNLDVTKNLFQALGGKLIVRHRPHHGEILTIFLPLETRSEA